MNDDDEFERFLRKALREEYQPPPFRGSALWARVTSGLEAARARAGLRRRSVVVGLRIAAAVIIVAGTGFILLRRTGSPTALPALPERPNGSRPVPRRPRNFASNLNADIIQGP